MAGYSGTPLLQKLGIKQDHRVLLRNSPPALPEELKGLAQARHRTALDVVLLFAESYASFKSDFEAMTNMVKPDGMIWVAWPKKASGIRTDLSENQIRDHALTTAFVDVKVCAINDTWSGLKFVIRKEHRAAFAAQTRSEL